MHLLNETWRERLEKAARLTRPASLFLLRTLVIHPALLALLIYLLVSWGSAGEMYLNAAENLVRDAPAGQVWQCRENDNKQDVLIAPLAHQSDCSRQAISGEQYVSEVNATLMSIYQAGGMLSLMASALTWLMDLRVNVVHR